jgi:T5SS/PEP-CTERM-associated repeat protein/autotransporter-associated beta strand protein
MKPGHYVRARLALTAPACAAAIVAVAALPASAVEHVWDGGGFGIGGNTLWTSPGNWSGDAVPPSGVDVRFGTGFASGLRVNASGDRFVGTLTVDTAAAFELANFNGTGNTIFLNEGDLVRTAASANTQTISSNLTLGDAGTWTINGSGGLVVAGRVTAGANTGANIGIEKYGTGDLTFSAAESTVSGPFTVAAGRVALDGGAEVRVNTASNFLGLVVAGPGATLAVRGGAELKGRNTQIINDGGSAVVSGAASLWEVTGATQPAEGDLAVGPFSTGALTIRDGGSVTATDFMGFGQNEGSHGRLLIESGGSARSKDATLGVLPGSRGTVTVTGAGSRWDVTNTLIVGEPLAGGMLTVAAGARVTAGFLALRSGNSVLVVDGGTVDAAALADANGGALINLVADPAGGATAALNVVSSEDTTYASALTGAGSLRKGGTGRLTLPGAVGHTGATTVAGGTLVLPNGTGAGGPLSILGAGTVEAAKFVSRRLDGTGTLTATGPLAIGDAGRADGVAFGGTLNVGGHSVLLADADRAALGGTVNLGAGGRLNSFAGITLTGALNAAGAATVAGGFTNNGTVNGPASGADSLVFTDDVTGAGSYTGRVTFGDGFSPGNSPADVSLGTATFDPTTELTMELAGTTPARRTTA